MDPASHSFRDELISVTKVERVENAYLTERSEEKKYCMKKADRRSPSAAQVPVASHGTHEETIPSILQADLRLNHAGRNTRGRGLFGHGIYLSPHDSNYTPPRW